MKLQPGASAPVRDWPAHILAASVRLLPRCRREWGLAMQAELAAIDESRERWRLALGCALSVLRTPSGTEQELAMTNGLTQALTERARLSACIGLLTLLPFAVTNWMVVQRVEPFLRWLRPDTHTSGREYALLAFILLLMPLGAWVALRPWLARRRFGWRPTFWLNIAAAVLLAGIFTTIAGTLGSDIYACEVLHVPNCD